MDEAEGYWQKPNSLVKVDIESSYWIIPVHPDDSPYLEWDVRTSCMLILPCCLGCALPKIFNVVANAVEWILRQMNIHVVHYLDLAAHALSGCNWKMQMCS